jgi:hypothetical protein
MENVDLNNQLFSIFKALRCHAFPAAQDNPLVNRKERDFQSKLETSKGYFYTFYAA